MDGIATLIVLACIVALAVLAVRRLRRPAAPSPGAVSGGSDDRTGGGDAL
jgi:hypothetical protein